MLEELNTINQPNVISAKTMSLHDLVVWLQNVNGKYSMCYDTVSSYFDDYVLCCNHKIFLPSSRHCHQQLLHSKVTSVKLVQFIIIMFNFPPCPKEFVYKMSLQIKWCILNKVYANIFSEENITDYISMLTFKSLCDPVKICSQHLGSGALKFCHFSELLYIEGSHQGFWRQFLLKNVLLLSFCWCFMPIL